MQSISCRETPAFFTESLITLRIQSRWCCAVSRGRNPSPGGVMYVCLTLERTAVDPSGECLIIPAPSLLADPSRPSAKYGFSEIIIPSILVHRTYSYAYLATWVENVFESFPAWSWVCEKERFSSKRWLISTWLWDLISSLSRVILTRVNGKLQFPLGL